MFKAHEFPVYGSGPLAYDTHAHIRVHRYYFILDAASWQASRTKLRHEDLALKDAVARRWSKEAEERDKSEAAKRKAEMGEQRSGKQLSGAGWEKKRVSGSKHHSHDEWWGRCRARTRDYHEQI